MHNHDLLLVDPYFFIMAVIPGKKGYLFFFKLL